MLESKLNKKFSNFSTFKDENLNDVTKWSKAGVDNFVGEFDDNGIVDADE